MARIRLSAAASVVPTAVGVQIRSDLRTFLIDGRDVQILTSEILPLLDGRCDKEGVISQLKCFSRGSVLAFLDLLEKQGLLETVSEDFELQTAEQERLSGCREFFRKWTAQPDEMAQRLSSLTDLRKYVLAEVPPWGSHGRGNFLFALPYLSALTSGDPTGAAYVVLQEPGCPVADPAPRAAATSLA